MTTIQEIKKIIIIAFASDDELMETLVLKGGNAIDFLNIDKGRAISRASYDMDFSIEHDFDEDLESVNERIKRTLTATFYEYNLIVFDYKFTIRPKKIADEVKDFWGGYNIEFKLTTKKHYEQNKDNFEKIRRESIPILPDGSSRVEIEISKYEFTAAKKAIDVEGFTVYIYSEEMIVFEKLRAICQQLPGYAEIIPSHSPRLRARDFYDIYIIMNHHFIDPSSESCKEMIVEIFNAKHVPLVFIKQIRTSIEFHRQDWQNVLTTISAQKDDIKDFNFYVEFVLSQFENITFQ